MTYKQVRDVVGRIRVCHQRMRESLERPRTRSPDPRTRRVLEALRRDEQELQLCLAQFDRPDQQLLLDTWLQYAPVEELWEVLDQIEFTPEMTADEVVALKLEFDQALIRLLRQLGSQTAIPRVAEFFALLRENVESRASRQAWGVREYQGDGELPIPEQ